MKKLLFIATLLLATMSISAQNRWFVGATGTIGYVENFSFGFQPRVGYEITDRWAVGTGIGISLASGYGTTVVLGIAEPFVRFCAWHNDLVFIDISATSAFAFDDELEACQIGLRPGLRFRINDHWDVAANLGFFGAQYTQDHWSPAFGLTASSVEMYFDYRF